MILPVKWILKKVLPLEYYEALQKKYWKFKNWHPIKKEIRRIKKYIWFAGIYPLIYRWYSRKPLQDDKVLFIEPKYEKLSNNFLFLYEQLSTHYNFNIQIHYLREFFVNEREFRRRCISMIRSLATSRYVFLDEGLGVLGRLPLRKETQIVQLWHACGAFKKFGFSTAELIFGATRKEMEQYPFYKYCTLVTVSSPEIVWAYAEAMGVEKSRIQPLGVSRTDYLFREDFRKAAQKKFELFMPQSVGKKIILFAPTFRGRVAKATTSRAFSIPLFFEALSEDFVLVIKHHPFVKKRPVIPEKYREFAVDFTQVMDIEELLCVADICISDYSSLVFEYSLFEKPMLFFAYDLEEYFDWRGFYYKYDELTPGPIFKTNLEMIDYIQHIEERFDKQRVIDFRDRFMSACDGHVTERIMSHVFGTNLTKYEKQVSVQLKEMPDDVGIHENAKLLMTGQEVPAAAAVRERLLTERPELAGKKLIAYFVTTRKETGYPLVSPYINWQLFYEYLHETYAVLYKQTVADEKRLDPAYYEDMFIDCSRQLTEGELLGAADIVVADYRESLLRYGWNKPFYIYIPDYRWLCMDVEDYESSTKPLRDCGCIKESTYELIASLRTDESQTMYPGWAKNYISICRHLSKEQ